MSSTTSLDAAGAAFIAQWEGGQSPDGLYRAYWDPFGKVWTIGIGETAGVRPGMVWTREQAYQDLMTRFARDFAPAINEAAANVELNPNQFNGFASGVWNLGPGLMGWDVGRYLRAGEITQAADALLAYDRAGGQVLAGLTRRRQAERALILTPYTAPAPPDPHHYLLFDTAIRQLGHGRSGSERQIVTEYDRERAHWVRWPHRLHVLRQDLQTLADRLQTVMETDPAGNEKEARLWRHVQLQGRAHGNRYA